jgi:hypothetical protein
MHISSFLNSLLEVPTQVLESVEIRVAIVEDRVPYYDNNFFDAVSNVAEFSIVLIDLLRNIPEKCQTSSFSDENNDDTAAPSRMAEIVSATPLIAGIGDICAAIAMIFMICIAYSRRSTTLQELGEDINGYPWR